MLVNKLDWLTKVNMLAHSGMMLFTLGEIQCLVLVVNCSSGSLCRFHDLCQRVVGTLWILPDSEAANALKAQKKQCNTASHHSNVPVNS